MSITKRIAYGLACLFTIFFISYSLLWFWIADEIRNQSVSLMTEARENGVYINSDAFGVSGYPFTPEIRFIGNIKAQDTFIYVPSLFIKSTFMSSKPINITADQGFVILQPPESKLWSLSYAKIDATIPEQIPETLTHEDLTSWRQQNGRLMIDNIVLKKEDLIVDGSGYLSVDDALQPTGEFNAKITGHMSFLSWLQENDYVETKESMLAMAVLSGLSKSSENSGDLYMNVGLTLQNQTLFVGPLRLAYLPSVRWAWRNELDLLQ